MPDPAALDYLIAVREVVTDDDWRAIVTKAREQAARGDEQAIRWLRRLDAEGNVCQPTPKT